MHPLNSLHGSPNLKRPLRKRNVFPSQSADLSNPKTHIQAEQNTEISRVPVGTQIIRQTLLFGDSENTHLLFGLSDMHSTQIRHARLPFCGRVAQNSPDQ